MAQAVFPPNPLNELAEQQLLLKRPEVFKMVELDRLMANILSRRDLSAEQRAKEYSKVLSQYQYTREKVLLNGPYLQPNIPLPAVEVQEPPQNASIDENKSVDGKKKLDNEETWEREIEEAYETEKKKSEAAKKLSLNDSFHTAVSDVGDDDEVSPPASPLREQKAANFFGKIYNDPDLLESQYYDKMIRDALESSHDFLIGDDNRFHYAPSDTKNPYSGMTVRQHYIASIVNYLTKKKKVLGGEESEIYKALLPFLPGSQFNSQRNQLPLEAIASPRKNAAASLVNFDKWNSDRGVSPTKLFRHAL